MKKLWKEPGDTTRRAPVEYVLALSVELREQEAFDYRTEKGEDGGMHDAEVSWTSPRDTYKSLFNLEKSGLAVREEQPLGS